MKNAVLGTTALVAVGALVATPASASEKIQLGVGGYMQSTYFYQDSDEPAGTPSRISDKVTQEGEIFFTGSTTLDNGLKFGVNVQLEAYTSTDQIDETYIFVEGSFGRVLLGSENSASYLMHFTSPSPVPMFSADSNNVAPTGQANTTYNTMFSDADKITYFTPRFAGFQFGASYVPDGNAETGSNGNAFSAPLYEAGLDRGYSVGVNYVNKFGEVDLGLSAGFEQAEVAAASEDQSAYSLGGTVGFAGFTLGAGYAVDKDLAGVSDSDRKAWSAGVKYGMGPWAVGVQYSKTTDEPAAGSDTDATTWVIGGQYVLGPGITAFGGLEIDDNDLTASTATRMAGKTNTFFVGTAVNF